MKFKNVNRIVNNFIASEMIYLSIDIEFLIVLIIKILEFWNLSMNDCNKYLILIFCNI